MRRILLLLLLFVTCGTVAWSGQAQATTPAKRPPQEPNAEEQLFIYLLNKARSDPPTYGKSIALDLNDVKAQPALALNKELTASARFRSDDMLKRDYFAHVDPDGTGPNMHAVDSGYNLGRAYTRSKNANNIESIAAGREHAGEILKMLVIDEGVPDLGHRKHLLGMSDYYAAGREIGAGILPRGASTSKYEAICAIHIAARDQNGSFVTGVVYEDKNENGAYDAGEGLPEVSIITDAGNTVSLAHGGFSLFLPKGPRILGCHKGAFKGQSSASLVVSTRNIHVEFVSGKKYGIIDFVKGREK